MKQREKPGRQGAPHTTSESHELDPTPVRPGRWPLLVAVAAVAMLLIGPLLAYLELIPPIVGFSIFGLSGMIALIGLVAAIVAAIRHRRLAPMILAALAISAVPIAVFGWLYVNRPDAPPINDVTTDLDDPPVFVAAAERAGTEGADLSYPDAFREPVQAAYGDLDSQLFAAPVDRTLEAAREVARELGWRDIQVATWDHDVTLVEGVAVSGLFRFRDDVVIRIRPHSQTVTRVDVRSRSRDGRGDLGVNAERIRRVQAALRETLPVVDTP